MIDRRSRRIDVVDGETDGTEVTGMVFEDTGGAESPEVAAVTDGESDGGEIV